MMIQSSMDALKAMRFTAMAAELERQLGDPSSYSQLSFEERLSLLVDAEWNRRQQNRMLRCLHNAHLAVPNAVIEDIEYMTTDIWTRPRSFALPPASTLTKGTTSSSKAPPEAARPSWPALSATPRAGSSRPSGIYVCRNCWRS